MLARSMQCNRGLLVCRGTPTHRDAPMALRLNALVHPSARNTCGRGLLLFFLYVRHERLSREHQG
jgi:hypothetical protein